MNGHLPEWFRVPYDETSVTQMNDTLQSFQLNTVCTEADCPNLGECWHRHTATFMILGKYCTRNCRFCSVPHGKPENPDVNEPSHIADAVQALGLHHVVITQVTRDDLADGGASQFAACIRAIRNLSEDVTIEVLISDMKGDHTALDTVMEAGPDIIGHNLETVPSLYAAVRPQAIYSRSLDVLAHVKECSPKILTKTGIMVGLGETKEEVLQTMEDARANGCDIFTIGQYLRPGKSNIEMKEYVPPEEFEEYRKAALQKGFRYVASGPLVRSSYHAEEALL